MIIDFMKKMRSELTDRKLKLESEQNRIQGELNRNNKFLQNLKQEEDQSYDVFSPRRKNSIMYSNICELEKKRDILIKELEEIKNELHISEKQYFDCCAAIHSYRNVSVLF